jgi:hypothetical protein
MACADVTLATGVWREGTRVRHARVDAPTPEQERALFAKGEHLLPAERVTLLLGSCAAVGGETALEAARALSAGDRVALLLELRRLMAGDSLPCVLDCPWPDCGERLELDLAIGELLDAGTETRGPTYELDFGSALLSFRLPTGADEERAARTAVEQGPATAVAELMRACLLDPPPDRAPGMAEALGAAIADADPHAEISLALRCPVCERDGEVAFDAASYLWRELEGRLARLDHDVHVLASRYGWSEAEILGLGDRRRARYLELVELEPA